MFQRYLQEHSEKIVLVLIVLIAVLSIRTLFHDGTPITWDHPLHIMASWNMADNLLPQGKPLGYDPYNFCGWVFAQYPASYMVVSVVYYLGFGLFSIVQAYKITILLAYILPIVSLYICLKSLGFDAKIALSAAFFQSITFLDEKLGVGIYFQVVYAGNLQQPFSIALLLIAVAMFHQACLRKKDDWILYAMGGGVFASGSLLMHPSMIVLLFLSLGAYFFLLLVLRGVNISVSRLLYVLAINISCILGLSAFFLLPYFSYLSNYFPYVNIAHIWRWSMPTIVRTITHNMTYFPVLSLGLIGFVICEYGAGFSKRFLGLITLLTIFLAFGIDFLYSALWGLPIPGFDYWLLILLYRMPILYSRYLAFLRVLISGLAGVGFVYVFEAFRRIDGRLLTVFSKAKSKRAELASRSPSTMFAILIILLCLSSQIQSTDLGYGIAQEKRILLSNDYPIYSKFSSAVNWIKDNVPVETRVLIQDTFGETVGTDENSFPITSHVFSLTPMYTGVSILGGWAITDYLTNDFGVTESGRIFRVDTDQIQNVTEFNSFFISAIRDLGIGFVLSHSENFTKVLRENKVSFDERYSDGVFHIFQLKTISRIFEIDAIGADLEIVDFESNYLRLNVHNLNSAANLQIKMIFYANWKCYVDGEEREIKVDYGTLGLPFMSIRLNRGDSQIVLRFEDTSMNLIGGIVSWTAALVVISIFIYYARKNSNRLRKKYSLR